MFLTSLGAAYTGLLIVLINRPPWNSDLSGTRFGFIIGMLATALAVIATARSIGHLLEAIVWLTIFVFVLAGALLL